MFTQPTGLHPPGFPLHYRVEGYVSGLLLTTQSGIEVEDKAAVNIVTSEC